MSNEMITQLPQASNANLTDIIYAVQGYSSPTVPGTSVQETLAQVIALAMTSAITSYAGNPNGNVAGILNQLCWDSTDQLLFVCTTAGTTSSAVWTPAIGQLTNGQLRIGSTGTTPVAATLTAGTNISINNTAGAITINATGLAGIGWTNVTGTTQAMAADNGYLADNSGLLTLTLPTTAAFGTVLYISGYGAGGWSLAQNSGQNIIIGSSVSTTGVGGSVSSTNRYDSVTLLCAVANTTFVALGAPQGNLTIV